MQNIPLFGSSASLIPPPGGTVTSGYLPLEYLPAENLNYYLNATTQAVQEIVTTISGLGGTPASTPGQMYHQLAATYGQSVYQGLILTYVSTTSFSCGSGIVGDSTFTDVLRITSTITKTTASWAVGSATGGLDTGSIGASSWYYVYVIKRPDTGVTDILFSLSSTAPTMPTNYTLKRMIGAIKTNASSQFIQWIMYNNGSQAWVTRGPDISDATLTTARKTYNPSTCPAVACICECFFSVYRSSGSPSVSLGGDTSLADQAPSGSDGTLELQTQTVGVSNDERTFLYIKNGTIFSRSTISATSITFSVLSFNIRPYN